MQMNNHNDVEAKSGSALGSLTLGVLMLGAGIAAWFGAYDDFYIYNTIPAAWLMRIIGPLFGGALILATFQKGATHTLWIEAKDLVRNHRWVSAVGVVLVVLMAVTAYAMWSKATYREEMREEHRRGAP